ILGRSSQRARGHDQSRGGRFCRYRAGTCAVPGAKHWRIVVAPDRNYRKRSDHSYVALLLIWCGLRPATKAILSLPDSTSAELAEMAALESVPGIEPIA